MSGAGVLEGDSGEAKSFSSSPDRTKWYIMLFIDNIKYIEYRLVSWNAGHIYIMERLNQK